MGACFHIEGVECDNCRGLRPYHKTPTPYRTITIPGTAINVVPTDPTEANLALQASISALRDEFDEFKKHVNAKLSEILAAIEADKKPVNKKRLRR